MFLVSGPTDVIESLFKVVYNCIVAKFFQPNVFHLFQIKRLQE